VAVPTGSAAKTFFYNESSGLWENDYYTWDPVTKMTAPKYTREYTYDPATKLWDSYTWEYSPVQEKYIQEPFSVAAPPAGAVLKNAPVPESSSPVPAATDAAKQGSASEQTATTAQSMGDTSENSESSKDTSGLSINNQSGIGMTNEVNSLAASGNALLQGSFQAGNVATGNAQALATVLNLLQSSAALTGGGLTLFTTDIQGDATGNLLIDPAALMDPEVKNQSQYGDIEINNHQEGRIQNDISLDALSGDASAVDNTNAGNISTGDANAVANVINLINAVIAANQSFLGVVNIYGNYSGDILLPEASLNALLASNGAVPAEAVLGDDTTDIQTSSSQHISNNTELSAVSGAAVANDNTKIGDVTTGESLTKLTILNLTGHSVTAENSLLVFVNVLGKWVGVIMDAPQGATAAALTGGASATDNAAPALEDGANTSIHSDGESESSESESNKDVELESDYGITNNIRANARSGDASAEGNFSAGNVKTGKATASASIANLINSAFSLSNWFGVLFINVFGSWTGNFGVAQPENNTANNGSENNGNPSVAGQVSGASAPYTMRVFNFSGGSGGALSLKKVSRTNFATEAQYQEFVEEVEDVLGDNHVIGTTTDESNFIPPASQPFNMVFALVPLGVGIIGITFVVRDNIKSMRRKSVLRPAVATAS
jgi:hypothetical protein